MDSKNISLSLLTKRCGKINPDSIDDYIKADGYKSLKKALKMSAQDKVDEIKASNLKGRGGAGFPTGIKMEAVLFSEGIPKYIVCNADEGEPGNFKDKYLMENDPHQMLEGMIIAANSVGASKGFIYIRGEYDKAIKIVEKAIIQARENKYLGKNILGSSFEFDIEIRSGAGAYVCGEEFALMVSIEGLPGRSTFKPPYPTQEGVFGKPTLINNVETFSNLPIIIDIGAKAFKEIGTDSSSGTRLISLSGNVINKGLYEVPFGVTIREVIDELGGGVPSNTKIKMVQLGGASGPIIPEKMLDIKIDYDELKKNGLSIGSGAIIVIDDWFDVVGIVKRISEFFAHESCGKCTPCREGTVHILKLLDKFIDGIATNDDLSNLESLSMLMCKTSLCGLGQAAPTALITGLKYFSDEFTSRIIN